MNPRADQLPDAVKDATDNMYDLKSTQPNGADNTQLKLFENSGSYDVSLVIPASGGRVYFGATLDYTFQLKQWQKSVYTQFFFQVFIDTPTNKYNGVNNSQIRVFNPAYYSNNSTDGFETEISNLSGVSRNIYIKMYAISTAPTAYFVPYGSL